MKLPQFFDGLPLIYREEGSGTRLTMERFIQQLDVPVDRKLELASNEAVKQAVLAGLGLSIIALASIKNELQLDLLKIIPVQGLPIQTTWSLVWPSGKKHSPAAKAFLEYLQSTKEAIIEEHFSWQQAY